MERSPNYIRFIVFFIVLISSGNLMSQTAYLVSPTDGSTNIPVPAQFNWSGSGMEYYWIQIDDDPGFGSPVIDDDNIVNTTYSANSLQYNTTYHWRINGHVYDTWGGYWRGFTSSWSFTTECPRPGPPNLLEPLNGTDDVELPVFFDWDDIFGVYEYEIQIDDNSDFSSIEEGYYLSNSQHTSSSLNQDSYYFWRIRARFNNGCSWGSWGATWGFSTECPVPNQANLIYPANNEIGLSAPLILDWDDVSLAEYYHLILDDDPYYNSPEIDYDFSAGYSDYTVSSLDIDKTYYWKVLAYNSCGDGEWSLNRQFTTACPTPEPPAQLAPFDGATDLTLPLQISWSSSIDQIAYRLQVDDGLEFGAPTFDYYSESATFYNINSFLEEGKSYYWRIKVENNCGWSNWSPVWEFSINCPTVATPVLVAPDNGSEDEYLPVILDWGDVPNASGFHIQIDNHPAFSSIEIDYEFPAGPSNFYPIGISEGVTYFWKVKATNSCFESGWSEVYSFVGKGIPLCGDVNNDESIDILDIVHTINFIYKKGLPPCSPVDLPAE
ncbi:MAG: Ig-like domain-containing protein [candidate division Zixibacteria bacterium]|nr:Ig-like domain-containing protein [candidate division Zixibacteria bacterium]